MVPIIQEPHPTLRRVADPVPVAEISSKRIQSIISDMKSALHRESDGVAIAAPQINVPLRIFIIAGSVFQKKRSRSPKPEPDRVFINPEFTKLSKRMRQAPGEGCLSVRWLYGTTERHAKATVRARDEHSKEFEMNGSDLLAQIFQHETDHLNGVLFIDHAHDIHELDPLDTPTT